MKLPWLTLFCASLLLSGCDLAGGSRGGSNYDADWQASQAKLKEQQAAYDKHSAWVEEQQRRQDQITAMQETNLIRHGKMLDKWEEQARRMDALLEKAEASRATK